MIRKLASIKLTFFTLIALVILLLSGVGLTLISQHQTAIEQLNTTLIHHWFLETAPDNLLTALWMMLICLASALLLLNALCCTLTALLPMAHRRRSPKQWCLFAMHILFLAVLVCHGLFLMSGHKSEAMRLFPGQSVPLPNGLSLVLETVTFVDDHRLLAMEPKKSRQLMSRQAFHARENKAGVRLMKNQTLLVQADIKMLKPLVYQSMRITLNRFLMRKKTTGNGADIIGMSIAITPNTFTSFFFTAYGLLILTIVGYIISDVSARHRNRHERSNIL